MSLAVCLVGQTLLDNIEGFLLIVPPWDDGYLSQEMVFVRGFGVENYDVHFRLRSVCHRGLV